MIWLRTLYFWAVGLGFFGPVLLRCLFRSRFQTPEQIDPWLRSRLQRLFKLLSSNPIVEFAEPLPEDEPLIFMANHGSLLDIPLLKAVIPTYFLGVIAADQLHYFLYGSVVKRLGNIPISRDNVRSSLKSFRKAREALDKGTHITVLPEGSRSRDGGLLPFKRLVFHFAKESGAHIVPISISGVFEMKNKNSKHLRPGKIVVRFGHVFRADMIAELSAEALSEMTYASILHGLEPFETQMTKRR